MSQDVIGSIKIELVDWKTRPKAKKDYQNLKLSTDDFQSMYIEYIEKKKMDHQKIEMWKSKLLIIINLH